MVVDEWIGHECELEGYGVSSAVGGALVRMETGVDAAAVWRKTWLDIMIMVRPAFFLSTIFLCP